MHANRRTIAMVVLVFLAAASGRPDDTPPHQRWAVIANPEIEVQGFGDRLTAELSKLGVDLVERQEIASALKEFELSRLMGHDAVSHRVELGKLVRADALALVSTHELPSAASTPPQSVVRVVLTDCHQGVRLRTEQFPASTPPDDLARACAAMVIETRSQFADGVKIIVAIPPFQSQNHSRTWDLMQSAYADIAANALAAHPGVAILEVTEARSIGAELKLAHDRLERRVMPLFVEGSFQMSTLVPTDATTVTVKAKGFDARGERFAFEKQGIPLAEVGSFLGRDLPGQFLKAASGAEARILTPAQQFERLVERADQFARVADWPHATALREAALLICPENVEQAIVLIVHYSKMVAGEIPWPVRKPTAADRPALDRLAAFRRLAWQSMVHHTERLIHHKHVSPREADALVLAVTQAAGYQGSIGIEPWRREPQAVMSLLPEDWRQPPPPEVRDELHRLFRSVYPVFPSLDATIADGRLRPPLGELNLHCGDFEASTRRMKPQLSPDEQVLVWTAGMILYPHMAIWSPPVWLQHDIELSDGYVYGSHFRDRSRYYDTVLWLLNNVDVDGYLFRLPIENRVGGPHGKPEKLAFAKWLNRKIADEHTRAIAALTGTNRADLQYVGDLLRHELAMHDLFREVALDPTEANLLAAKAEQLRGELRAFRDQIRDHLAATPDVRHLVDPLRVINELDADIKACRKLGIEPLLRTGKAKKKRNPSPPSIGADLGIPEFPKVIERVSTPGLVFDLEASFRLPSQNIVGILPTGEKRVLFAPTAGDDEKAGNVVALEWDGRQLWLARHSNEIRVIDRNGRERARWNEASGLPRYDRARHQFNESIVLRAVAPGQCLAIGRHTSPDRVQRSFIALLTVDENGAADSRILLSAPSVVNEQDAVDQAFQPWWTARWTDPKDPGKPLLVIRRNRAPHEHGEEEAPFARRPLIVDLTTFDVRVSSGPFPKEAELSDIQNIESLTHSRIRIVSPSATYVISEFECLRYDPGTKETTHMNNVPVIPSGLRRFSAYEGKPGLNNGTFRLKPPEGRPEAELLAELVPRVPAALRKQHFEAMRAIASLGGVVQNGGATLCGTEVLLGPKWRGKDSDLEHLPRLYDLNTLCLAGSKFGPASVKTIAQCDKLKRLELYETPLRDADLAPLAGLRHLTALRLEGTAGGNEFSDAALEHFKEAPLVRLTLYGPGFTDKAARFATAKATMNHLFLKDTAVTGAFIKEWKAQNQSRDFYFTQE